ncbi:oxidoreductase [Nakamurella sp. GG22]
MTLTPSAAPWEGWRSPPEVAAAVEEVRGSITALRRHPANRTGWPKTAAVASMRAARASAALDGAPLALDAGTEIVTDPVVAGSLRVAAALGSMASVWTRSPLQVLARLHTLAAADLASPEDLGRPRSDGVGLAPALSGLAGVAISSPWPAPVQVAMIHGRLLTLQPFEHANGVVARAAARLTVVAGGLDPAGLGVPEVAFLRHRTSYEAAASAFAAGNPDFVTRWVLAVCGWLVAGAREGQSIADAAV